MLITGAGGFAGTWLARELVASGHVPVAAPGSAEMDVTDAGAVEAVVSSSRPDAVAHLAAVSYGPDASRDPARAFAVNAIGTLNILEAVRRLPGRTPVLVTGSSEIYGTPRSEDLPLTEDAPIGASQPYGRSKLAQEQIAIAAAHAYGMPIVVSRAFNHTGPGQREQFVAPAFARRVLAARDAGVQTINVGNLDVERDIGDVRDVVRAYRMLIDAMVAGTIASPSIFNIATGHRTSIRTVFETLCRLAGVAIEPIVDERLVRPAEPPVIVGDATRIRTAVGWAAATPIETTLRDLWDSIAGESEQRVPGRDGAPREARV